MYPEILMTNSLSGNVMKGNYPAGENETEARQRHASTTPPAVPPTRRRPRRRGGLRDLVEQHLRACPGASFTLYQIGKALPRSADAVANSMDKLVSLGVAELATCVLIYADTRHSCYRK